jgi:hypothetical protein
MTALRQPFTQEFKDELCREVISTSPPIKDVAEKSQRLLRAGAAVVSKYEFIDSQIA